MTIICTFLNLFPFSKNMDYNIQFKKYLSILQKRALSYAISANFFTFTKKTWTIMCNLWNLFLFSKNMDYHIQFQEFFSFHQKHGLSYALSGISFPSPKTLSGICNFCKFRSLFQKRGLS